jgi:hypothetical protein
MRWAKLITAHRCRSAKWGREQTSVASAACLKGAISGCSGAWLPPPKYRNSEARKKGYSLVAHFHPVPDRRSVSVKNLTRPAQKTVYDPVQNTSTMKEGRDLSLDKARLHLSDAIDAQIDCDDASDDLIKEKLHSTSVHQVLIGRPRPYCSSIRQG